MLSCVFLSAVWSPVWKSCPHGSLVCDVFYFCHFSMRTVSWVSCGAWLYRFLVFVFFLYFAICQTTFVTFLCLLAVFNHLLNWKQILQERKTFKYRHSDRIFILTNMYLMIYTKNTKTDATIFIKEFVIEFAWTTEITCRYELRNEISNNVVCVTSKASDQPVLKVGCTGSSESTLVKCHIVGNHMPRLIYLPQQEYCSHTLQYHL